MDTIQWFPGHMAKARRLMKETLPLIDVVIELLDARIPSSSRNPEIDRLAENKKRLVVLNKSDMADKRANVLWEKYFADSGCGVLLADSITGAGLNGVGDKCRALMSDKLERMAARGRGGVTVRAMVAGIPNVGKSAFINKIIGRRGAETANRPGVTRANKWLKVSRNFELLDTPGILWHKFEDEDAALRLALTGAIKDDILDKRELCHGLFTLLNERYPTALSERFGISYAENAHADDIIAIIAEKRGHKIKGGILDTDRTHSMLLDEFRKQRLGKITLEMPPK